MAAPSTRHIEPILPYPATATGTASASLGALTAAATGTPTVTGTANAALGSLTAHATGTPTVLGTATASLGALTAAATGTVTVVATANAPLGALTASATGTVTVIGVATANLGGLTASATGTVIHPATTPAGGNLTKPRLHLGNSPGRTQQSGSASLIYRLAITGHGEIETPATLGLPHHIGTGELQLTHHRRYRRTTDITGTVHGRHTLNLDTARSYNGTASEDPDDLFVLLTIGD